jgi:hypothetical protein
MPSIDTPSWVNPTRNQFVVQHCDMTLSDVSSTVEQTETVCYTTNKRQPLFY